MAKYLIYDIENEEPIKISTTLMQLDNEFTRSYIPGSVIRGAYIANYINIKNVENINEGIHKEKLLKGGVKFLNAYPLINENRAFPFPKCFYSSKDDIKKYKKYKEMNICILEDDSKESLERVRGFEFVDFDFYSESLQVTSIEKINNIHIKKETKNKIFRYEAISPNNRFRGIIKLEDERYIDETKEILLKGLFYIGGSKGSGYGKCEVKNIELKDGNPELEYFLKEMDIEEDFLKDEQRLTLYTTSDIIFRDNKGRYKTSIDEDYIKEKLGLDEIKYENSFIETEYFTGFNNKWGYKSPILNGIKAGSIFLYSIKGKLDFELVQAFMEEGIGERESEGFGNFILLPSIEESWHFNKIQDAKAKITKTKEIKISTKEDKEQLNIILNRIYLNKLKDEIPNRVLKLSNKIGGKLRENQIGKLMNLMDILQGMSKEEGVERLEEYFEHIYSKKINRDLAKALNNVKVEGVIIREYLAKELKETNIRTFQNKYSRYIKLGEVEAKLPNESQSIYEYKLKILKELFRLQLKDKKGGRS